MTSHDTAPTFTSKVNLVLVPVVVRDRQGHAVGNLSQSDFQLFDRGKPQVISRFVLMGRRGLQTEQKTGGDGSVPAPNPSNAPGQFTAYLFDDVHISFSDLVQAREAAIKNLDSMAPSERVGVFATSGQGNVDFTDDRVKLKDALLRLKPRPIARSEVAECPDVSYYLADLILNKNDTQALAAAAAEAMTCLQQQPGSVGAVNLNGVNVNQAAIQAAQGNARRALSAGEAEAHVALTVVKDVLRRMSTLPGQRTLTFISPGFVTTFDRQYEKSEVAERALHSNVVINSIDARGLYVPAIFGDITKSSQGNVTSETLMSTYINSAQTAEEDVLAEFAYTTGGTFFHNNNDLVGGFKIVASPAEFVYQLGFTPQDLKFDGKFHGLKVTLTNSSKMTVQARRGYFSPKHAVDPAEAAKQEIEEAMFSRDEIHDLPIELHTQFFKSSADEAKLAVLIHVDVKHMRFHKEDGRNRNDLTVVSGLFDSNGNYMTGLAKVVEMRLRDDTLATKLNSGITVKSNFDVKPGSYVVRMVVRDTEGHLMSALSSSVEIP